MSVFNGLFTSESVSAGHPDKICDQISDAILDAFLTLDPNARVACETFAADNKIIVAGEFRTAGNQDFLTVRDNAAGIIRDQLRAIGYGDSAHDIDPDSCEIEVRFNRQSPEIEVGVDHGHVLGAGDQGLMFGYACDETKGLMPLAWALATDLIAEASSHLGRAGSPLRPDGKAQVTVNYENGEPVGIKTVVLSWQHRAEVSVADVQEWLRNEVLDQTIPDGLRTQDFEAHLNPAGPFTIGGPKGDTGLTGRKIIVDTYGGACPHGGGAFSGKDPSKVDRSAAYAARHVAKNIVGAGLARRCTVQLAYAIGVAKPVSINVDTHGTGKAPDLDLSRGVEELWDLTPAGIIRDLELLQPIYRQTSVLGHFGQWREQATWERLSHRQALVSIFGA
jgi:S-adenosylmethionine synthetase